MALVHINVHRCEKRRWKSFPLLGGVFFRSQCLGQPRQGAQNHFGYENWEFWDGIRLRSSNLEKKSPVLSLGSFQHLRWCQHFDGPIIWNPCHVKIWGMNLPNPTLCISVPVFVAHRLIDHLVGWSPVSWWTKPHVWCLNLIQDGEKICVRGCKSDSLWAKTQLSVVMFLSPNLFLLNTQCLMVKKCV